MDTFALHALMYDSVKQRPAMITECWTRICVHFESMFVPRILTKRKNESVNNKKNNKIKIFRKRNEKPIDLALHYLKKKNRS